MSEICERCGCRCPTTEDLRHEGAAAAIESTIDMIVNDPALFLRTLPTDVRDLLIEEARRA